MTCSIHIRNLRIETLHSKAILLMMYVITASGIYFKLYRISLSVVCNQWCPLYHNSSTPYVFDVKQANREVCKRMH